MNKYKKMTKVELEEIVRSYTDFSKYTREEMLDEIKEKFEEVKSKIPFSEVRGKMEEFLAEDSQSFSDEELKECFRDFYCSDWTRKELLREIKRHERFEDFSREELEEEYELLKQSMKVIIVEIIMGILVFIFIVFTNINQSKVSEKEIETLEQKIEQQEEKIDRMEDIINAIIDVIVSETDNVSPMI